MTYSASFPPSLDKLIHSPEYFLTNILADSRQLEFVKTEKALISEAAFIDGRTRLSVDGDRYLIDWDHLKEFQAAGQLVCDPARFIFHVSFCGSTLLARACTIPGRALCYKEPQALIALSTLRLENHPLYESGADWSLLKNVVLQKFNTPWQAGETTLLKPSNWVNSFLPELMECHPSSRAVLLIIEPEDFLIAVLRGGRERITYICNLLRQLQRAFPHYSGLIEQAAPLAADPWKSTARLILLVYEIQMAAFRKLMTQLPSGHCRVMSYNSLISRPEESLALASETLALGFDDAEVMRSVELNFARHSKNREENYDRKQARIIDQRISREYQDIIGEALDWHHSKCPEYQEPGQLADVEAVPWRAM